MTETPGGNNATPAQPHSSTAQTGHLVDMPAAVLWVGLQELVDGDDACDRLFDVAAQMAGSKNRVDVLI